MNEYGVAAAVMAIAGRIYPNVEELGILFIKPDDSPETIAAHIGKLHEHDVVVSCYGAAFPILGKGRIERALRARRRRPMLLVDLGTPKDVEAEVGELEDVFLYTAEDLGRISTDPVLPISSSIAYSRPMACSQSVSAMSKRNENGRRWSRASADSPSPWNASVPPLA
jgi:hypothetical protein